MIIGVDASRAVRDSKTGTENYSWELLKELVTLPSQHTFWLYAPHLPRHAFPKERCEWKIIPPRRLWSQIGLSAEIKRHAPQLLFVPSHVIPLLSRIPSVVTVHDLAYKLFPKAYPKFDRRYLEITTGISAAKATRVIVPSQATADDLVKYYKADGRKIRVIAHGYNKEVFRPTTASEARPIAAPYLFFLGRIETKKNLVKLIEAFSLLAKQHKTIELVLAGKPGYGHEEVLAKISAVAPTIRERIKLPGYLSDADVARHLRHAEAFVFPSLYEGFGLPVLEAMACGCPVVCSDIPALREVAGASAATFLPGGDALGWAAAIGRLLDSRELRAEKRDAGLKRAQSYSWRKAAEETLKVLEDAGSK